MPDQEIREIDVVELTEAVGHWPAGAQGTVVSEKGDLKMLEMEDEPDDPLDFPVVSAAKLKLIEKCADRRSVSSR